MQKQNPKFIFLFLVMGILYAFPADAGAAEVGDNPRVKGKVTEPSTEKPKEGEKEKKTEDQKVKTEGSEEEKQTPGVQYITDEIPEIIEKKEEESVFGFNFLYYIIQRFKLSDFTV